MTVVGLFTAPLRDLVGVLDARIRQLEEQGEEVPAEEAPTEEATEEQPEEPSAQAEEAAADEEEEQ
jgi:hypothetical protein